MVRGASPKPHRAATRAAAGAAPRAAVPSDGVDASAKRASSGPSPPKDTHWLLHRLSVSHVMAFALGIRVVVMLYGEWQDANMAVRYTDVDYAVYTDAARLVAAGRSPFERTTYRYTPALAIVLLPNVFVHEAFGKLLFVAADMLVGGIIVSLLRLRGLPDGAAAACAAAYLLHPLSINVSTRGNADPLVCALSLLTLYFLLKKRVTTAAVVFGAAVHLKIYPIVYALPIELFLNERNFGAARWGALQGHSHEEPRGIVGRVVAFLNPVRVKFALVSAGTFFALTGTFYVMYGYEFLFETYLYHFVRADNRHNFSLYFYDLYLRYDTPSKLGVALVAFFPQMSALVALGVKFSRDLPFAMLAQTIVFVAFNKVCTAQYFLWFLCLLPLVIPTSRMPFRWGWATLVVGWFAAEFHWLGWAYQLEFLGLNSFLQVWAAGVLFFVANIGGLAQLIRHHEFVPTMWRGAVTKLR